MPLLSPESSTADIPSAGQEELGNTTSVLTRETIPDREPPDAFETIVVDEPEEGELEEGEVEDSPRILPSSIQGSVDTPIITPKQVVDHLILTSDDKEATELEFKAGIEDINGTSLRRLWEMEGELRDDAKRLLRGFLQNVRDYATPLPWAIPSPIPSFDLHCPDSDVCTPSSWKFSVSARELQDERYYHLKWKETPTSILVHDPLAVLRLIRTESGAAYSDAASALYREGVKFQTLVQGPAHHDVGISSVLEGQTDKVQVCKGPRLGYMKREHQPDAYDFFAYISARNQFLRVGKGRAAALAGGVITRIVKEVVEEERVINGPDVPEVFSDGKCYFKEGEVGYWDDYLTEREVDLICGVYYCETNNTENYGDERFLSSHRSWFPRPGAFNSSNLNVGFWSKDCEKWYQHRVRNSRSQRADALGGRRWRGAVQFNSLVPKIVKENRSLARTFLESR
ncbi:hypothetical protein AAF712_010909 [Marasmius tenuissimus]|uniref:Uncharacterized protein n=1 Tax=Marasmius tenuissimus TaxID=585030 RepID=A0ABR2ZM34_9AGAR